MDKELITKLIKIYTVLAVDDLVNDNLTKSQERAIVELGNLIQDGIDELEKAKK